jgi:GH24 family phage-related lysozyme (muramidase)
MQTSQAGLDLIKSFEGCSLTAYQDSAGVNTIGWGHTDGVYAGECITDAQAEAFLVTDLHKFEYYVNQYVTAPITQHQFDALVSFCYNLGPGTLYHSPVLTYTNAAAYDQAAAAILLYDHAGGEVVAGLTRRREAESQLYLTPDDETPRSQADEVTV